MAAVRRWTRALAGAGAAGQRARGPGAELPAFRARTPFLVPDDGKNLNRCFPGNPDGTVAERLAHAAFTQLIVGSDALIDATPATVEALEPFALYDGARLRPSRGNWPPPTGSATFRPGAWPRPRRRGHHQHGRRGAGIPAIIAEAGGCGLVEAAAVEAHVRGLDQVLAVLGMTGRRPRMVSRVRPACVASSVRARRSGGSHRLARRTGRPGEGTGYGQQPRWRQAPQMVTAPAPGVPLSSPVPRGRRRRLVLGLGAT